MRYLECLSLISVIAIRDKLEFCPVRYQKSLLPCDDLMTIIMYEDYKTHHMQCTPSGLITKLITKYLTGNPMEA